jgi:hypothetical protein
LRVLNTPCSNSTWVADRGLFYFGRTPGSEEIWSTSAIRTRSSTESAPILRITRPRCALTVR